MIFNPTILKQAGGGKVYKRTGGSDTNITSKTITLTFDEPVDSFFYYGVGWHRSKNQNVEMGMFGPVNEKNFVVYREANSATATGITYAPFAWADDKKSAVISSRDAGIISIIDHLGSTYHYIGIPEVT